MNGMSHADHMHSSRQPGLASLIADLVRDSTRLGAQELALLRTEMSERADGLVGGLVILGGAAIFAVIALGLGVEALVKWLTLQLGSELAALLTCGGAAGIFAVGLYLWGRNRLALSRLALRKSAESLQEDLNLITRRF